MKHLKITPWRRFFARILDIIFFGALIEAICVLFFGQGFDELFLRKSGDLFTSNDLFVWSEIFLLALIIPIEAIFIHTIGTTPFKALFKISILDINRQKLSFANSFKRSFLVWFKGLGLGIIAIWIITFILSYRKLKIKKTTSWDQSAKSFVYCGRLNFIRVATPALFVFISLMFAIDDADKEEVTFNKTTEKILIEKENNALKETASEEDKMKALNLEKISESTALIISGSKNNMKTGSGFFIKKNLLVTNSHVVENAIIREGFKIVYIETQQKIRDVGYVFAEDKKNDLAIIKTIKSIHKPLYLGNYSQVQMGDEIFVLGSPHGLFGTLSKGIVSAKRKSEDFQLLQITAPISRGSSGSPVLSKDLKVVAIAASIIENGQNINFAIPVIYLKKLIRENEEALIKISKIDLGSKLGLKKNILDSKTYESIIDRKIADLRAVNKSKNHKQTFNVYQELAMRGDANAQYNLGLIYKDGKGVSQDYRKAFYWFQEASKRGNTNAQYNLGLMYVLEKGVPKDFVTAYAYLSLAVFNGNKSAVKLKNKLAGVMSSDQIAKAQRISFQISQKINQRNPAFK